MRALILAAVILFLIATFAAVPPASAESPEGSKKLPAIGKIFAKDKIELNADVVKRRFADGGRVDIIALQRIEDEIFLVRMGHDAEGGARTEAMALQPQQGALVPVIPVKIKICHQPTCSTEDVGDEDDREGGEGDSPLEKLLGGVLDSIEISVGDTNTCLIDGNTCKCSQTGTDCIFGIATELELHDIVIWQ